MLQVCLYAGEHRVGGANSQLEVCLMHLKGLRKVECSSHSCLLTLCLCYCYVCLNLDEKWEELKKTGDTFLWGDGRDGSFRSPHKPDNMFCRLLQTLMESSGFTASGTNLKPLSGKVSSTVYLMKMKSVNITTDIQAVLKIAALKQEKWAS